MTAQAAGEEPVAIGYLDGGFVRASYHGYPASEAIPQCFRSDLV